MVPATMRVVSVCHHDRNRRRLCLVEGISATEVSQLLGALFEIPGHKRVVGLAGTIGAEDVLIPLLAACRYPDLAFREQETGGCCFRIVTKDADRDDEVLFPVSALTQPPPLGRSDLSGTWAASPPELRATTVGTVMIPELVSSGALTPQQGAAAMDMVRAEDPVVFAACRVAGAAAAGSLAPPSTVPASVAVNSVAPGRGGGRIRGGTGASPGRDRKTQSSLASILQTVLTNRQRNVSGENVSGKGAGGGRQVGGGNEINAGGSETGPAWDRSEARASRHQCEGDSGGGYSSVDAFAENRHIRDRTGDSGGSVGVPEWFQADLLALADLALVTGKISRKTYVRALYKAVTLDPDLVQAFNADISQHQLRSKGDMPRATLRAFNAEVLQPAVVPAPAHHSHSRSATVPEAGAAAGIGSDAEGGVGVDEASMGAAGPYAREVALRDGFLRQAVSLVQEGRDGLNDRHRAIVEYAIAAEHPWVLAIYDECKETGDVRGLLQNLQRLPALLERDQAAAFGADISQPPPPGEAESLFWPSRPRQRQEQHQQQQQQQQQQQSDIQPPHREPVTLQEQLQRQQSLENRLNMRVSRDGRMATPRVVSKKLDAIGPEAAISPAAPKVSAGAGATADGDNRKRTALREGVHPANGIGSDGENHGAGSFDVVVAQLCRVISGCSQLLRLRDVIGEEEEEALNIMSRRGSPVLLTAVETYGANQDLEDLLNTLKSAAALELSTPANNLNTAVFLDRHKKRVSPALRKLPHQREPSQVSFERDARADPSINTGLDKGLVGTPLGGGNHANMHAPMTAAAATPIMFEATAFTQHVSAERPDPKRETNGSKAAQNRRSRNGTSVDVSGGGSGGDGITCPRLIPLDGGGMSSNSDPDGSPTGSSNASTSSGHNSLEKGCFTDVASTEDGPSVLSYPARTGDSLPYARASTRATAAGARAEELAAAKFAGMRSAAAAIGSVNGKAGEEKLDVESSTRRGKECSDSAESGGDKKLRRDVSELISVMAKQGMLTDRQRLFLLAQIGRPITQAARERHSLYLSTGNSKELYTVLMVLSTPSRPDDDLDEETDDDADDDDSNEKYNVKDEDSGEGEVNKEGEEEHEVVGFDQEDKRLGGSENVKDGSEGGSEQDQVISAPESVCAHDSGAIACDGRGELHRGV